MEQYAAYLRKSRFDRDYAEMSVEETLKRHEALLSKLAQERGYAVVKTYYEVVSGESIAARPEIQKLLEEVNAGLYAGVLVVDLERLARGNGADQAYISQVFQFSGTKIITPAKVYDPTNEFDEEYFEFGLFMSRREYKTINRRLIRGRDSSAAEGKYIGSIAPYGYARQKLAHEKGYTLAAHPEEAPIVQKIFALYLAGEGAKRIAGRLNDLGVPARHGDAWTYATVAQILSNPVYTGKIRRGWSKQVKRIENGEVKKHIKRSKDPGEYALYAGLHPPLISEEDFARAQEMRSSRRPEARVRSSHELANPFAGLLYCAVCGKRVERVTGGGARSVPPRVRCVNSRICHNRSAYFDVVEKEILSALRAWLAGYRIKIDAAGFSEDIAAAAAQQLALSREREKLAQQLTHAFDLVEQGIYTLAVFQERRAKLEAALAALDARMSELDARAARLQAGAAAQGQLIPRTEALLSMYDDLSSAERNALFKQILEKVEYARGADGQIVIDLYPRFPRL